MEIFTRKKTASIDLLKDEEKLKSSSQKKLVVTICAVVILLVTVAALSIFAYSTSQKIALSNIRKEIEEKSATWRTLESVGTDVKTIDTKDKVIVATNSKFSNFEKNINNIQDLLPEGITLATLVTDASGKTVISGTSSDAAIIYQFHEVLKKEKTVKNPTLDSLAKNAELYNFNISLNLVPK